MGKMDKMGSYLDSCFIIRHPYKHSLYKEYYIEAEIFI